MEKRNATMKPRVDPAVLAIISVVLGVLSLLAWLFPLIGFPLSVVGLGLGIGSRKSARSKAALWGIILSAIGLVLTLANSAYGIYLGYTGQLF